MCKIPLVQVAAELYLLVYELGPVTMVQLAAYQAASLGVVDPAMHDTIFAEYFQIVARGTVGMEALDIAYRRMFPFEMAGLLPPYRPRKRNIALKESKQKGAPRAIACTGPTKANRFTGRRTDNQGPAGNTTRQSFLARLSPTCLIDLLRLLPAGH